MWLVCGPGPRSREPPLTVPRLFRASWGRGHAAPTGWSSWCPLTPPLLLAFDWLGRRLGGGTGAGREAATESLSFPFPSGSMSGSGGVTPVAPAAETGPLGFQRPLVPFACCQ